MPFTISLTHNTVEAGTTLSGTIDVSLMESMVAKSVRVTFRGEERVRVPNPLTKQSSEAAYSLRSMSIPLEGIITTHSKHGGKIKKGTYRVPFQVLVPEDLPQTVTIPWTHVSYFVGYEVEDRNGNLIDAQEVPVNVLAKQRSMTAPNPFHREPFSEYVKKNRFKKGNIIISARIEDVVLEPGERVTVAVAVRNRSPLAIVKVKALLKQQVHATAVENDREMERVLTFYEFKEYRRMRRKRKSWLRGTDVEEDFHDVGLEVEDKEHAGYFRIPQNATLTYHGQLFDVKHFLHILIETDKDDLDIEMTPIELARKQPRPKAQIDDPLMEAFKNSLKAPSRAAASLKDPPKASIEQSNVAPLKDPPKASIGQNNVEVWT